MPVYKVEIGTNKRQVTDRFLLEKSDYKAALEQACLFAYNRGFRLLKLIPVEGKNVSRKV